MLPWCNSLGYRLSNVRDLTNASCQGYNSEKCGDYANEVVGATPSSPQNTYMRHIGAGFFTEWGDITMQGLHINFDEYWTQEVGNNHTFAVLVYNGQVRFYHRASNVPGSVLCVYP